MRPNLTIVPLMLLTRSTLPSRYSLSRTPFEEKPVDRGRLTADSVKISHMPPHNNHTLVLSLHKQFNRQRNGNLRAMVKREKEVGFLFEGVKTSWGGARSPYVVGGS